MYKNKFWEIAERVGANMNKHEIDSCFKIFDRNRDGYIDTKELKNVTRLMGTILSKEEVAEFMAEADVVSSFLSHLTICFARL